ncbi:4-amino-4-deoxy-L-arabinose transferase-like glycosyltransferase [Granulicella aggregans]|uniref:4-amino-4-deoxy-L-arabinose transferase-like glycosyltransferase n=1 Tax=Granulicella aggregans TaxID=474949 RepID=A0A7W7ZD02_9BACT|nr:glycosyltransferase family 39 protein [Granulicella aggregans]MBB5057299.1 4-amino-4-deoxy-L-arabinose transferase-like glycosyltransferase [Granulicella aggregans]
MKDEPYRSRVSLEPILLSLLVGAAFLIRVWGVSRAHFWDEMVYLQNAQVICCGKSNYSELSYRPPLISLLFAGVFLIWHSVYAASIVTALVNALGSLFLYRAAKLAFGRTAAAISALLLAHSPFFVGVFPDGFLSDDTGNSLLTDSPALTLLVLALWLLLRALAREKTLPFAWAGVVLGLAVLMRFGSLPSVGLLFLLPLAARSRWKALLVCVAGFLVAMVPYLVWSRVEFGGFFQTFRDGWANVEGPEGASFLRIAPVIFTPIALVGLAMAACWGLWRGYRGLRFKTLHGASHAEAQPVLIEAFLWMWLLVDFAFFGTMAHKEPRYVLPLAPPLLMLAGAGLALFRLLPRRSLRLGGGVVVVALLMLTFVQSSKRFGGRMIDLNVPEEMSASQFLQDSVPASTALYMNFNYPVFAYYTGFRIHEMPPAGADLYKAIKEIPAGGVFIVYRESEGGEPDLRWMDSNTRFQRMRDYSGFVVYRCTAHGGG